MTKVLIVGSGEPIIKSTLLIATSIDEYLVEEMKERYGDDVVLVTPEEAEEKGMNMSEFDNMKPMRIVAPPIIEMVSFDYKDGKQKRRERRAQARKARK